MKLTPRQIKEIAAAIVADPAYQALLRKMVLEGTSDDIRSPVGILDSHGRGMGRAPTGQDWSTRTR